MCVFKNRLLLTIFCNYIYLKHWSIYFYVSAPRISKCFLLKLNAFFPFIYSLKFFPPLCIDVWQFLCCFSPVLRFLCFYFYFMLFVMLHQANTMYASIKYVLFLLLCSRSRSPKLLNKLNCKKGCNHFIIFSTFTLKTLQGVFRKL